MPLAPAIATVRDAPALGLVVIVSSLQNLCVPFLSLLLFSFSSKTNQWIFIDQW
jgi:hypothetical protein